MLPLSTALGWKDLWLQFRRPDVYYCVCSLQAGSLLLTTLGICSVTCAWILDGLQRLSHNLIWFENSASFATLYEEAKTWVYSHIWLWLDSCGDTCCMTLGKLLCFSRLSVHLLSVYLIEARGESVRPSVGSFWECLHGEARVFLGRVVELVGSCLGGWGHWEQSDFVH